MTSRATLNVTRRDEPHFHLGRRSSTFCGVWGGSRAWTRFFPTALERGAAPILRECSINCWGDPWQQRSSNQPPSLSTSLTLSRTNTYLQTPHSRSPLLECSEEGITRKRLPPGWKFRDQGDRPGASQVADTRRTSGPGDSREDPVLRTAGTASFSHRQDASS